MSEKENNPSLAKLISKVNHLLNEIAILKNENREYEKIHTECLKFLKDIPQRNALHKKSTNLVEEMEAKMERLAKKKEA